MRNTIALTFAAVALVLTGCSSGGDMLDSTESVCDEFAAYVRDGGDRAELVASIGEVIANADQQVRDAYPTLQNTVDATGGATTIADDTFANACLEWGWDG